MCGKNSYSLIPLSYHNGFDYECVCGTLQDEVANQGFLEKRINLLKETALKQWLIDELMQRLSLARASKSRIYDRLKVEVQHEIGVTHFLICPQDF